MLLYLIIGVLIPVSGEFNPFADEDLFTINWAGPAELDKINKNGNQEIVTVHTEEDERYHCVIPESQDSRDANRKATYNGATPDELMEALFLQASCSYRIESYWTYELCHGSYIKQYHDSKELGGQKPKLNEYYLGRADAKKDKKVKLSVKVSKGESEAKLEETDNEDTEVEEEEGEDTDTAEPGVVKPPQEILSMKIDGLDLPYYSVNMSNGDVCDLTGKPRLSHIKYICQPNGRGEIYLLKETGSCEYDIVVLTAVLCAHPDFKPKDPPVAKINCHAVGKSPARPLRLTKLETEGGITLEAEEVVFTEGSTGGTEPLKPPSQVPSRHDPQRPNQPPTPIKTDTIIGKAADKQLLRDFLAGEYCLHGGGSWWKHEFCYNKHAKQYHEEPEGVQSIYLGYWDRAKHIRWLNKNPSKKPKPVGQRKQLSLYYSQGDKCDLTGQDRYVEVKLKCLNKPNQPHAVSIYLVEPKSCQYVLGVESPIFCDIFDEADQYGLLDNLEL